MATDPNNKRNPNRPQIVSWNIPSKLEDYLPYPHAPSGVLIEGHANWRLEKPIVDCVACKNCGTCELLCPDAAIFYEEVASAKSAKSIAIDYELCKGCGICAFECKFNAIKMEKE
ncbi:2-ketoisovalerate ferredoxin oxidoreductase subunit delta [Fibrobacterales bacterium]|nr:2-ketoisovalerate ferredoxin oxidoreductase subunit delta [Fibrobacterales bacterium]